MTTNLDSVNVGDWVDVSDSLPEITNIYETVFGFITEINDVPKGKLAKVYVPSRKRYVNEMIEDLYALNNDREIHEGHVDNMLDLLLQTRDFEDIERWAGLKALVTGGCTFGYCEEVPEG